MMWRGKRTVSGGQMGAREGRKKGEGKVPNVT